ncbi:MAG: class I SAM-dependent methyltransferase [Deltaproteobacteria bacterium]|nr:class I SAM-dependent methyltransferase [Deltaproteobacteria bacterium]
MTLNNARILEVATGAGEHTADICDYVSQTKNISLFSIDNHAISFVLKKKLQQWNHFLTLQKMNMLNLGYPSNHFDIVSTHTTIEALTNGPVTLIIALNELRRVLKKNGFVAITSNYPFIKETDVGNEWSKNRWLFTKIIAHLLYLTHYEEIYPAELKKILQYCGFGQVCMKKFQYHLKSSSFIKQMDLEMNFLNTLLKKVTDSAMKKKLKLEIVNKYESCRRRLCPAVKLPAYYVVKAKKISSRSDHSHLAFSDGMILPLIR